MLFLHFLLRRNLMTTESEHFQYSPIWNHSYDHWFREVQYNGRELNEDERREFLQVVDETISTYSGGLPLIKETLEQIKDLHDEFHEAYSAVISVLQFTTMRVCQKSRFGTSSFSCDDVWWLIEMFVLIFSVSCLFVRP